MDLTLYYAPLACSLVPLVALKEADAPFKVHVVNFRALDHQHEDYARINPKRAVPVLLVDGTALTENVAILQWIADSFAPLQLLPTVGMDKYRAVAFLAWCASGIHPFLTPNARPQRYCDLPGTEDNVRACAQKMLKEKFAVAEDALANQPWFFGRFSLADVYFFWCFRRAGQFDTDLSAFPRCQTHYTNMMARPSVQQALAFETSTLAELAKSA